MNLPQLLSLIRKAITLLGAWLIQNGHAQAGNFLNGEDFIGAVLFVFALAWSHLVHTSEPADAPPGNGPRTLTAIGVLASLALFTGCSTTNISELTKALASDPAAVHISVMTPYANVVIDRANPGTNNITVGSNGITTK